MAIDLVTNYIPYVDELFASESKASLVTNNDFNWDGAHAVKIYKISTAPMGDYGRTGPEDGHWSRYGAVRGLDATTETLTLRRDRSFTFAIDLLDMEETGVLQSASTLARQLREVVIPEVDGWVYQQMCDEAGHKPAAKALTKDNILDEITIASEALDTAEVPETERYILVTPQAYRLIKLSKDVMLETDIAQEMRLRGVIAMLDGAAIIKVPANRLPDSFGFMMVHPIATVAPTKLTEYVIHNNPPGISGSLVEGRICYDAFVLDNKAKAIYLQNIA